MKWFKNVTTIEELRKQYRALLKKYHPDTPNGSVEATQEINREYDIIFAELRRSTCEKDDSSNEEEKAQNEAFKAVLNEIIVFNMEIEIIGSWIWCFNSYQFRNQLKELGFKYAPKKRAWTWHYGEFKRYHKGETNLDDIRAKYGSQKVNRNYKQYSLD